MANADPVEMYLNDVFTVTVNLAGSAGHFGAGGAGCQGAAAGAATDRAAVGRGRLLNHAYVLERAAGFVAKPAKWW
jgi:aspartyl-tRNA(Asn)/glutamyl-tRNA(Gln) amidotransferase subunit A